MFSYYNLENSIPIAITEKTNKKVYFIDNIIDEKKLRAMYLRNHPKLLESNNVIEFFEKQLLFQELSLPADSDDQFIPIQNKQREVYSIIAPSGSGKSVLCSKLIKQYIKQNPDNEVFLLSNKDDGEDPAYKDLNIQYINVLNMTQPVNLKNFDKPALIIIDDLLEGVIITPDSDCMVSIEKMADGDYIKQQKIMKARQNQLNDIVIKSVMNIMTLGRSKHISLYLIKHSMRDGKSNILKTENTGQILFPNTSKQQIKDYTKNIMGFSKKESDQLFKLKESQSRHQFLFISCQGIKYIISNKNIYCNNNIDN